MKEILPLRNLTSLGKFLTLSGLRTHEICILAVAVLDTYATWIKDGSESHLNGKRCNMKLNPL